MGAPATLVPVTRMAAFVIGARPSPDARARAALAVADTIGVALAGSTEVATLAVQRVLCHVASGSTVWGARAAVSAPDAALVNGTAAHALDYDDMCFVSLAHPSAPLVPAIAATAELTQASGRALLEAYVVGFELQARLGRLMNPRHYQRGWHCTSTLGAISAAAGSARLLGLDAAATTHALAIAASSASGLKENFGTMVKPLHAGLAARDGALAALLAKTGLTGSAHAIDGPQGYLQAFDSERMDLGSVMEDLGSRWEILETGITVKLYPSCAGTHPTLDAVLDLRRQHGLTADDIDRIDVDVDGIVPTILIHDRPSTGLEAKFSMPYCVAAAVVHGRVGVDSFDDATLQDPRVRALLSRVSMHVDPALDDGGPPLTRARVHVQRRDGRVLSKDANGARGYPAQPATAGERRDKFLTCARRAIPEDVARRALEMLERLDTLEDVRVLTAELSRALAG